MPNFVQFTLNFTLLLWKKACTILSPKRIYGQPLFYKYTLGLFYDQLLFNILWILHLPYYHERKRGQSCPPKDWWLTLLLYTLALSSLWPTYAKYTLNSTFFPCKDSWLTPNQFSLVLPLYDQLLFNKLWPLPYYHERKHGQSCPPKDWWPALESWESRHVTSSPSPPCPNLEIWNKNGTRS